MRRVQIRAIAIAGAIAFLLCRAPLARAGCGLDVFCAAGEAAGKGAAEGFLPQIREAMDIEGQKLINLLKEAVDHNIISAEQAADRVLALAIKLAQEAIAKEGKGLINYARVETEKIEAKFIADLGNLIKSTDFAVDCQVKKIDLLLKDQVKQLSEDANSLFNRAPAIFGKQKDEVSNACLTVVGAPANSSLDLLEFPSLYKVWRCARLTFVNENSPARAILAAYEDLDARGKAAACAAGSLAKATVTDIGEIWFNDAAAANAWKRAIDGN